MPLSTWKVWVAGAVLALVPKVVPLYWVLATSSVVLTLLPVPIPEGFKAAVRCAAARGKLWHDRPASSGLGFLADASVPQAYFEHFYFTGGIVNLLLVQLFIFVCCSDASGTSVQRDGMLAMMLLEAHLIRRWLETSYLMHYPETAQMHLLAYLFGLSYYVVVPLTLLPASLLDYEAISQAVTTAVRLGKAHWQQVDRRLYELLAAPHPEGKRIMLGIAIFVAANLLQLYSHWALGRLSRRNAERAAKDAAVPAMLKQAGLIKPAQGKGPAAAAAAAGGVAAAPAPAGTEATAAAGGVKQVANGTYSVPRGGVFEMVSCPHYLAEILVYVGLAVVTRGSLGSLLILTWVVVNLVLAADATHKWYLKHLPSTYPPSRKALVPFVF